MTIETLIQKRAVASEEFAAVQKRIQELAKAHGEAVNELVKREGQIITLNQLIDELSPKPEPVVESTNDPLNAHENTPIKPKLEVVKLKPKPKK